jgi:hypothetical protein
MDGGVAWGDVASATGAGVDVVPTLAQPASSKNALAKP